MLAQHGSHSNTQMVAAVLGRARTPQTLADLRKSIGGDPAPIAAALADLVAAGRVTEIRHAPLPVAYKLAVRS